VVRFTLWPLYPPGKLHGAHWFIVGLDGGYFKVTAGRNVSREKFCIKELLLNASIILFL
jgi:hypothetical protein